MTTKRDAPSITEITMTVQVHHHNLVILKQATIIKIEADDHEDNINHIDQVILRSILSDIDILEYIDKNLKTTKFILQDISTSTNNALMGIATNMYYMEDNTDYKTMIESECP